MQVYLLVEYGGQWEDYYEYTIGCYKNQSEAEEMKLTLEKKNKTEIEQKDLCNRCPCYYEAHIKDFG